MTSDKALYFVLAAALCLILFAWPATAETSGTCGSNLTWVLDDEGTLAITGEGAITSSPWKAVDVKHVVISEGVTSIGSKAFYYCTGLTSVSLPDSVTSIGGFAFAGCYDLTDIRIPDGVTSIGEYAFADCQSLMRISIPEVVASIGEAAFAFCENLTILVCENSYAHTWCVQNGQVYMLFCAEHAWASGVLIIAPTASSAGKMGYTCLDCGDAKAVAVAQGTTGDVNDDGNIDMLDIIDLMEWYCDGVIELNLANGEVNGDTCIDMLDVITLMQLYCSAAI